MGALGEEDGGIVQCPPGCGSRGSHGMLYCLAWLILKVEVAAKSWATAAIVQADSRVAQTSARWNEHMDAVDTHQRFGPEDTWLRRIGTCQTLG